MPINYRTNPVATVKWIADNPEGNNFRVILRGWLYGPMRIDALTTTLGQALTLIEQHLRFWGYNEVQVTRTLANTYRSLRRRYKGALREEANSPTQEAAQQWAEPYPD